MTTTHPRIHRVAPIQIVLIDAKPSVRKQILRELQIMHDCNSNYIISFWGAFISDPNICICMEFMDKGSLDGIYKKIGPIDIEVVGMVALATRQLMAMTLPLMAPQPSVPTMCSLCCLSA